MSRRQALRNIGNPPVKVGSDRLLIGADLPNSADGTLHVHTSSVGSQTAATDADDLVVENINDGGITLFARNTAACNINFGDQTGNAQGQIKYNNSGDVMSFNTDAAEVMRISGNKLFIGDTANAYMANGITINQAASDDECLTCKSSDVAHGMTAWAEADTYGFIMKTSGTAGGIDIRGFSESVRAWRILGGVETETTTDTTGSDAAIITYSCVRSGTSATALGTTGNLFAVTNTGTTRFLVKGNGVLHAGNATVSVLDDYDDVALISAYEGFRTKSDAIREEWSETVDYHYDDLVAAGILGKLTPEEAEAGEEPLWCVTQHILLLDGAARQEYRRSNLMAKVLDKMVPGFGEKFIEELAAAQMPALPSLQTRETV
tara:strand:+ start:942 stop:2072 length:1131 start_codon:yes stop_codon:yes gene_type:complete